MRDISLARGSPYVAQRPKISTLITNISHIFSEYFSRRADGAGTQQWNDLELKQ